MDLGLEMMALETHPKGLEGVYEDNLPWVMGVKVEIKKSKRYVVYSGSEGEGRGEEKQRLRDFFSFLKGTRTN